MKFLWFQRQQREAELDAEIRSHLDEAIRDRMERGETLRQAVRWRMVIGRKRDGLGDASLRAVMIAAS